jgi:hypothetical protein
MNLSSLAQVLGIALLACGIVLGLQLVALGVAACIGFLDPARPAAPLLMGTWAVISIHLALVINPSCTDRSRLLRGQR